MFGESNININETIKLDSTRHIIIPKNTLAKPDDQLLIMYGLLKEKIIIGEINSMLEKLKELEEGLLQTNFAANKNQYLRILEIRRFLYGERCLTEEKIDKRMKILLPKEAVEELELKNQLYVVGNENRLDIYKDEETYLNLKKRP